MMSQATSRKRKHGARMLYSVLTVVLVILALGGLMFEQQARHDRQMFARDMLRLFSRSQRVEVCPGVCFTQDHRQYRGIHLVPTPNTNKKE